MQRPAPRTVGAARSPSLFGIERFTSLPELFLAVIPDARVLGPNGTVITPDGGIVEESTWPRRHLGSDRSWASWRLPACSLRAGAYYTIASPCWGGYYHWVTEVLPRLHALDALAADDLRIIVNAPLNDWQRESLSLLGCGGERCLSLGTDYLRLEVLFLPSWVGDPSPHPFACRWLRERLLPSREHPARRRLYVTRRMARGRRVRNERELEPMLLDRGFEIVESERLSFAEQIALFSQAEVVAGPHGAGLTNVIFAPEGCTVLELFQPSYLLATTYKIAHCLGHRYWYLLGRDCGGGAGDTANVRDMLIDRDQFGSCLDALLMTSGRDGDGTGRPAGRSFDPPVASSR